MYKRLFLLIAIIAMLSFSQVAYANFGAHKDPGYGSNICTACHRNHEIILNQGVSEASFVVSQSTNEYNICNTCHGPEGAGADTDIVNGVYKNPSNINGTFGEPLNSGGFEKVGGISGRTVTSTHSADGTQYPIFGNSSGNTIALTCTSCHDPDTSSNYRLLKDLINGKDVSGFVGSNEPGYSTISHNQLGAAHRGEISIGYVPNYTTPNYKKPNDVKKGITGWCAACHDQYFAQTSEPDLKDPSKKHYYYVNSNGKKRYRHPVNVRIGNNPSGNTQTDLPLAKATASTNNNNSENFVVCLTCHRAHGTDSTMTGRAKVGPTKSAPSSGPGQSALLRMDNRGVCQNCHKK